MAAGAMRKIRPAARAANPGGAIKVPITGEEELAGRETVRRRVLERDELFQNLPPRRHGEEEHETHDGYRAKSSAKRRRLPTLCGSTPLRENCLTVSRKTRGSHAMAWVKRLSSGKAPVDPIRSENKAAVNFTSHMRSHRIAGCNPCHIASVA